MSSYICFWLNYCETQSMAVMCYFVPVTCWCDSTESSVCTNWHLVELSKRKKSRLTEDEISNPPCISSNCCFISSRGRKGGREGESELWIFFYFYSQTWWEDRWLRSNLGLVKLHVLFIGLLAESCTETFYLLLLPEIGICKLPFPFVQMNLVVIFISVYRRWI